MPQCPPRRSWLCSRRGRVSRRHPGGKKPLSSSHLQHLRMLYAPRLWRMPSACFSIGSLTKGGHGQQAHELRNEEKQPTEFSKFFEEKRAHFLREVPLYSPEPSWTSLSNKAHLTLLPSWSGVTSPMRPDGHCGQGVGVLCPGGQAAGSRTDLVSEPLSPRGSQYSPHPGVSLPAVLLFLGWRL